jgi:hypothetical protein
MATLNDLKQSVEKVLGERGLKLGRIRDNGKTFHFSVGNVVDYLCSPPGFFNFGFTPGDDNAHVYRLYLGLYRSPQATDEATETMNRIIDIRNDIRDDYRNGQRPDFINEAGSDERCAPISSANKWRKLEHWSLGFTLEEFLNDQIKISAVEEKMRKALDYVLAWEKAVFSKLPPGPPRGDSNSMGAGSPPGQRIRPSRYGAPSNVRAAVNTNLLNALKQIVSRHGGVEILSDARRVKALLSDLAAGEPKPQKNALIVCLEQGFAAPLRNVPPGDHKTAKAKLAERLNREEGLDPALCADTLDLLEAALFG